MSIERVDACCHTKYGQCNAEFRWVCDVCHEESCTRYGSSLYHHGLSRKEEVRRPHFVMDSDRLPDAPCAHRDDEEPMIRCEQAVDQ